MQENEFEKQLKKMMEGFHISPSNSVWEKVSRKLNEKRRRKMPFFFLLAAGFVTVGLSAYYIYNQKHQNTNAVVADKSINTIKNSRPKDLNNSAIEKNNVVKNDVSRSANKSTQLQYNKTLYSKENVPVNNTNNDFVIKEKTIKAQKITIHSQANTTTVIKEDNKQVAEGDNSITYLNNQQPLINSSETQSQNTVSNNENDQTKTASNIQTEIDNSAKNSQAISQNNFNNSTAKSPSILKNKNFSIPKWQFGFNAFYGKNNLNGKLAETENITASYLSFNSGMIRSNDTVSINKHPFSASNAYAFGVTVKKRIFTNAFISSGLNFTHLSVKASIDKRINSAYVVQPSNTLSNFYAVNSYYQAGESTYKSKYNFIELPVIFQQYFFHSKQTSFSYNVGFSVRRLISSDALIYNAGSNIYFSKDDLLQKTQFQLNGGLNFEIKTGKSNSIFVGPQVTYSLSNSLKNSDNGNFHFITYGVQASFLLHKK